MLLFLLVGLIHSLHPLFAINPTLVQSVTGLGLLSSVKQKGALIHFTTLGLSEGWEKQLCKTIQKKGPRYVKRIVDVLCSRHFKSFINMSLFNLYNTL